MVAGIKDKAGVHEDAKSTAQRTVGQSVKQSWDCSARELKMKRRRRKRKYWQKENQMELQWAEDEKLEKILVQRRIGTILLAGGGHAKCHLS